MKIFTKSLAKDLLFRFRLLTLMKRKRDILVLATITKTGTHYLRFLFAYYLILLSDKKVDFENKLIIDEMFPNSWHIHYLCKRKILPPSELLGLIGLYDIPRSHTIFQAFAWPGCKVLHTYRNPLDFFVIFWIFKFRYHKKTRDLYEHPYDLVDNYIDEFCDQYLSFSKIKDPNVFVTSFEDLIANPEEKFSEILAWLGHNPNTAIVNEAVQLANQINSARIGASEKWQRVPIVPFNHDEVQEYTNQVIDLGSVGIWKHFFNKEKVEYIADKLKKRNVDLNEFILE